MTTADIVPPGPPRSVHELTAGAGRLRDRLGQLAQRRASPDHHGPDHHGELLRQAPATLAETLMRVI